MLHSMKMASILPLQPSVIDAVRATIVIHSLEQCVNELVQNSLDAQATNIEVKIDVSNFSLQVSDNGQGITRDNLGRIGLRYSTSKCQKIEDLDNIATYGFRGEALASIAEMSLMEIISKPRQQDHAYTALFRGGDRLLLEESSKQLRYGFGTCVSVRDLFFKFPVRQRQVSEQSTLQDIEGVKRTVEKLALAAPHVSFVIVDAFRDLKIVNLRRVDSLQSRIRTLLGPSIASSLIAVHTNQESSNQDNGTFDLACSGFISTAGYFNQLHQHLFLNNRPIHSQPIQSAIHHLFQQSNFGKEKTSVDSDGRRVKERHPVYVLSLTCRSDWYDIFADPAKTTVLFKEEERVIQLVRKMVVKFLSEQHFMSRAMATNLLQQGSASRKRRRPTSSSAVGVEFETGLESIDSDPHLFLPHVRPSRSLRIVPSSSISLDEEEDDWEDELYFELDSDWIYALTEDDFVPDDELEGSSTQGNTTSRATRPPRPKNERVSLPPRAASRRDINSHRLSALLAQDALRKWVNPVFPTAPISIPSVPPLKNPSSTVGKPINTTKAPKGSVMSATQQHSEYFQRSSNAYMGGELESVVLTKESVRNAKVIAQVDTKFILVSLQLEAKPRLPISKASSLWIKVLVAIDQHAAHERVRVEQMMREFCSCASLADRTHKVRCQTDSISMLPPIKVNLTQREWAMVQQFEDRLSRWGIKAVSKSIPSSQRLPPPPPPPPPPPRVGGQPGVGEEEDNLEQKQTETVSRHFSFSMTGGYSSLASQDCVQGYITSLPRLIADRCAVDAGLAQDLIKETLAEMEATPWPSFRIPIGVSSNSNSNRSQGGLPTSISENFMDVDSTSEPNNSQAWIQCIRGCPRAILDILYSKACRGAIMFNDVLRLDECRQLVHDLGKCAFPFQCAHGRPSAVPLAILHQQESTCPGAAVVVEDGRTPATVARTESARNERRLRDIKGRTRGATQWKKWLLNSSQE